LEKKATEKGMCDTYFSKGILYLTITITIDGKDGVRPMVISPLNAAKK
jgi:hypothetical protein